MEQGKQCFPAQLAGSINTIEGAQSALLEFKFDHFWHFGANFSPWSTLPAMHRVVGFSHLPRGLFFVALSSPTNARLQEN